MNKQKIKPPVKGNKKQPVPRMQWQTGKYSRRLSYQTILPYSFLLLCKLWQIPPQKILNDFTDNINHDSRNGEGKDAIKTMLAEYIIAMGYGQQQYTREDILTMFKELDALGMLFPGGDSKLITVYTKWRDRHYEYWFNKWYNKYKRNDAPGNTAL